MMSLSYDEMLDLTEEKLEKMGVTKVKLLSHAMKSIYDINQD